MKRLIILILLFTLNTSFMSKNDLWVICRNDNPNVTVALLDSKNRPIYNYNNDLMAMHFQTQEAAKQFGASMDVPVGFVGTRPIRY